MAARAIWKGVLRWPGTPLPVKLYSAAIERSVHFRLLHDQDGTPLEQRMVHPESGEPVDYRQALRGHPAEGGGYVVLTKQELDALTPAPSRDLEVLEFVEAGEIGPEWYERPYYLGPDGNDRDYLAFVQALAEERKLGVVRWTMRKREYAGALHAADGYLSLITLRSADEVVPLPALRTSEKARDLNAKELAMAAQLIGMFEGEFKPSEFHDEYRQRLLAFLDQKARGRKPELPRKPRPKPEQPLAQALAESLRRARRAA
jgi:DNA end-binding protein Ku